MSDQPASPAPGPWTADIVGDAGARSVVVVIHGGNWRPDIEADMTQPLAEALAAEGHWVWNVEYARPGMEGGGWPGTGLSVRAALRAAIKAAAGRPVVAVGHSAGGHLALWAARDAGVAGVVSLAGVTDLARAAADPELRDNLAALLGGDPHERPELLAEASPIARLPLGVPVIAVHGTDDPLVGIEYSRTYVEAARAAGDEIELLEVPGADHRDPRDPQSSAWPAVRDSVARLAAT
jgi:acetyl esterase/lipase